jgi:uncharacterized protein involved in exopolysaccharide biosynthesis
MTDGDYGGEREVDLARWRAAIVAWWWLPVAGLVVGGIVGALLALSAGSTYRAKVLLSLGQPFSPNGGAPVNGLITNPRTVGEIIRSESAIKTAARKAQLRPGQLRGHVSTSSILGTQARANAQPLVTVEVTGSKPVRVERAADALAGVVIEDISGDYVQQKIKSFDTQLKTLNVQVASVNRRISALTRTLNSANKNGLSQLDQLVLVNLLDTSEARLGGLIQAQSLAQQQLALAKNVESPRVVQQAAAVKTTARSRRTSILVGALIGLLLGAVAAIVVDARAASSRP